MANPQSHPPFTPFIARVETAERLAPHVMRVTFTGPELHHVANTGYDQRIKLLLPLAGDPQWEHSPLLSEECRTQGTWWDVWRSLPVNQRNPIRTYTLRDVTADGRVIIDFALHAPAGPAGTFAANAQPGDTVVLVAPDARSSTYGGGIDFHPGIASQVLLVGDETAAPAIGGIVDSLARADWPGRVTAFVETPAREDHWPMTGLPDGRSTILWMPRDGRERGADLVEQVRGWASSHPQLFTTRWRKTGTATGPAASSPSDFTEADIDRELLWETPGEGVPTAGQLPKLATGSDGFYAWVAGEAAVVRDIRRVLLRDHGLDRRRAAFMGYWRAGRAEN
ncbi:siderophore-interacting protein [Bifidobacterium vespertilionis]|uniref:siderophore-interacting protein n=1 Tax=Bifidobacterium vespertilionis TaxID=2562524 RepID=UPI001BDD1B74|nr:siderophore-interacting protein [Bifidobacterium vespertilionis]MBT1179226.1 siderophore-interacting protein [Bifidobacterium vespertilionis]